MKRILSVLNSNSELVSAELEAILGSKDSDYAVLLDSMRYSALGGGKRIRPTLTLEFSRLHGGSERAALTLAAAVEMVHTYSLIHDDLPCMDNDDVRRGKPTNHKVYGEATALLAGDALLTMAFSVICQSEALSDTQKVKAVRLLSEYAGANGMIGGQQIDLIGEKKRLTEKEHKKMNTLKTGALIRCAALFGCIAAEADEAAFSAAERYAENIGLAFQVTDDLLDIGEEDEKTTYLTFMTEERARRYASELTDGAVNAIKDYEGSETLISLARFLRDRQV